MSGAPKTPPPSSPVLRDVARWWLDLYRRRGIPARGELEPRAFPKALPYVWLAAYEPAQDRFRYRLAGEHVNETFGFSLRGRTLADILEPRMLPVARERYLHVVRGPGAVHATGRVYSRTGRHREGERLILPLAAQPGGEPGLVLGVTDYGNSARESPDPPPPEYMTERFLALDEVAAWHPALEAAAGRPSR